MHFFPAVIITSLLIALSPIAASAAGPQAGKPAPAVELTDLAGKTVSLAQFRGKVVLLDFWSTLCSPCVTEMPSLSRLYLALKDRGFEVIAVSIDSAEGPVREFAGKNGIAFPILLDKEREFFFDGYAGPGLPANYLLDRNGIIVEWFSGPQEWDSSEMKNRIVKLLEKR